MNEHPSVKVMYSNTGAPENSLRTLREYLPTIGTLPESVFIVDSTALTFPPSTFPVTLCRRPISVSCSSATTLLAVSTTEAVPLKVSQVPAAEHVDSDHVQ